MVKVNELAKLLNVTHMTIRRDLQMLEDQNLLIRVHGGARKIENSSHSFLELSHQEKRNMYILEKNEIAKLIADTIHDHDTVFLGSGSTIELVYNYLDTNYAKIITNSIYIFERFKYDERFDLILSGGVYRSKTGTFTGIITNELLSTINVDKAFIGVNAVHGNKIFNANEDEGVIQRVVLNNADKKYIVADHNKFDKRDFYNFYNLNDTDFLITDRELSSEMKKKYSKYVTIIN